MLYSKLYDDPQLTNYSVSQKNKIINTAVKLSRKDNPINLIKRLTTLLLVVFSPAFVIYAYWGYNAALAWSSVSSFIGICKLSSVETPVVETYIEQAISAVDKQD